MGIFSLWDSLLLFRQKTGNIVSGRSINFSAEPLRSLSEARNPLKSAMVSGVASFRLQSQMPGDLCDPTQQGLVLVVIVQMVGILPSPCQMAITAKQRNELGIEVAIPVRPVMTVGAGAGAEHTATSVTFVDVFSDSIPAFGLQSGFVVHGGIYCCGGRFSLARWNWARIDAIKQPDCAAITGFCGMPPCRYQKPSFCQFTLQYASAKMRSR